MPSDLAGTSVSQDGLFGEGFTGSLGPDQALDRATASGKKVADIAEAALLEAGFEVVLITNQGGLAKGLDTHEDVADIHAHLARVCEENGTPILDIFYSPHHPSTGKSLSRKPGSLMVERACAKHQLDPARSWMVGDKQRDLDAASPAGVRGVLIEPNAPLLDAVNFILDTCS